jgi:Uncharacterized protein conserved in bacteria
MMRRVVPAALFLALASSFAFSQGTSLSPDRGELASAGSANVVFVNYEGPSARIDSRAAIEGIGIGLGREIASRAASIPQGSAAGAPLEAGEGARYKVIRAADPSVKEGLDADILILGPDARVDHVRNLRWIIAGYLRAGWGYADKDSYALATFITIYNAVHRGDMKYFGAKYKAVVGSQLDAASAGLALNYAEWPGKSRIVVPLSSGAAPGRIGAVDTGAISDKAVVESLKAQADKGVPDRQALVDVKEREAAQKQSEADAKKAEAAQAEAKLAQDKAKAESDRAALEADKAKAASASGASTNAQGTATSPNASAAPVQGGGAQGTVSPNASGAGAQAAQGGASQATASQGAEASGAPSQAELTKREAAIGAEEASVKAEAAQVAAKKEEAAAAQSAADAKKEEAAADRKDITADQKTVIAAQVAEKGAAAASGVFLFRVGNDAAHLGQIVLVDPAKGTVIRASRMNSLHLRSMIELADAFVVVAGEEGKASGVKLVRLDKASLESVAEDSADMYPESDLMASGDAIYGIVAALDGTYYAARFAAVDLSEAARSKDPVAPYSSIRKAGDAIALQSSSGSFLLLKPDSLEISTEIKP